MSNPLEMSIKDVVSLAVNQRLILQNVDWNLYEQILEQYRDSNEVHFAYDDGYLEVEVPQYEHETINRVLHDFVTQICFEKEIDRVNAGSTTFRQRAKSKGVEPDTAFYIQNAYEMRGLRGLDLEKDPPPDLVIEVDITSPSLNKMPIYAALAVPEVWLYKGDRVVFYKLEGEDYHEVSNSVSLPFLDSKTATKFLRAGLSESSTKWIRDIRDWVKDAE